MYIAVAQFVSDTGETETWEKTTATLEEAMDVVPLWEAMPGMQVEELTPDEVSIRMWRIDCSDGSGILSIMEVL